MNDLNPNARLITHHTILSDPSINSAIALSFFASGMGAWVVYGSTEMGANPELSWLGVIGYSAASSLPALIICMIGPRVRTISGEKAFCTTDFGLEEFAVASNWTTDGLVAAVTLMIAIACDLAFFDLLAPLSNAWHIIVLIAVTGLAASSLDSLQTAIASILNSDIIRVGISDNTARFLTRFILVLINIPAVILSSYRFDVIGLFLVADLVCGTAVFPVFLGLITEDIGIIPGEYAFVEIAKTNNSLVIHLLSFIAPTELGAFLGIISGIAAVVINGHIIGFDQAVSPYTGEVIASGPFSYFWLTNSSQCALCGTTTMVTFIVVPLVAGFCTLLFSKIDIAIRGERAREPIFKVTTEPEECNNYHFDKQETVKQEVEFDADDDDDGDLKVDQPDGAAEEAQHPQVAA
eukprot:scaffold39746_cov74-Cyclotella_meneghiniana.AAC.9